MYETVENFSEVLPLLLVVVAAFAGLTAGRLAGRPAGRPRRRSGRRLLALLALTTFVATGELVLVGRMWAYGWPFAANRVLVALPPVMAALTATAVLSVPRLVALSRLAPGTADGVGGDARGGGPDPADPRLVVPVQAIPVAALLCFVTVFVTRPVPGYAGDVLAVDGVFALCVLALVTRQRRRRRGVPRRPWRAAAVAAAVLLVVGGYGVLAVHASRLPATYDMGRSDFVDDGGAGGMAGMAGMAGTRGTTRGVPRTSVASLTGDVAGVPDARFTLTARRARVRLASGRTVDAWTWNGQVPGPELRVHDGDLVQVTVHDAIRGLAVSVHWHGLDVPNAMDGVPGVTQDAIAFRHRFVYRFRVHQVGTFWYHSHESAYEQVDRGLFGALVVVPRGAPLHPRGDLTVVAHAWRVAGGTVTLGRADRPVHRTLRPGTRVRLRLVNTAYENVVDTAPPEFVLDGTAFRVAALDGTAVNRPGPLPAGTRVPLGAGGRRDLTFVMPHHPVRLTDLAGPGASLVLTPDGHGAGPPATTGGPVFDPARYGVPAPTPFGGRSRFDRRFTLTLDDGPGPYDGGVAFRPTVDGRVFPATPMLMVRRGDLVEVTVVNRGHNDHPMHLHGHHALVLAADGRPVTGSPWWTDTLEIEPGETYTVAFRADNPGIWMDHCHNLKHARAGMVMHLAYEGVTTPYRAGRATGNTPE